MIDILDEHKVLYTKHTGHGSSFACSSYSVTDPLNDLEYTPYYKFELIFAIIIMQSPTAVC